MKRRVLAIGTSVAVAVLFLVPTLVMAKPPAFTKDFFDFVWITNDLTVARDIEADYMVVRSSNPFSLTTNGHGLEMDGPLIVDSMTFTYTDPLTITGVMTDVRLLYYQE
jgi:hypothetical protein